MTDQEARRSKDHSGWRVERIKKLLEELEYEIEVGLQRGDITEKIGYRFVVSSGPGKYFMAEFRMREVAHRSLVVADDEPRVERGSQL